MLAMLIRHAFFAGLFVTAVTIVTVAWTSTLLAGPSLSPNPPIATPSQFAGFVALILSVPIAALLGLLTWAAGSVGRSETAKRLGRGILVGAAVGLLGGSLAWFDAQARAESRPPPHLLRALGNSVRTDDSVRVTSLTFSPDGATLISRSGSSLQVWRVSDGARMTTLMEFEDRAADPFAWSHATDTFAFSHEGTLLASATTTQTVQLWRTSDWTTLKTLEHPAGATVLAFSRDDTILASGAEDLVVRLWRMSDGTLLKTLEHPAQVTSLAFSPDGAFVASGAEDLVVRLWRTSDGTLLKTLAHPVRITSVAFSPDGRTLASGSREGVRLWSVSDWALMRTVNASAMAVAFWPDEATLAAYSDAPYLPGVSIQLWRVHDGQFLRSLVGRGDAARPYAFSPDGNIVASGSVTWPRRDYPAIGLWRVRTDRSEPQPPLTPNLLPDNIRFQTQWSSFGSQPSGVAVDGVGNVYVVYRDRVRRFAPGGKLLNTWETSVDVDNGRSVGVAVDAEGNVYVVTQAPDALVQVYTPGGELLHEWGSAGQGDGQFSGWPIGIAVDRQGNVYVGLQSNRRDWVQVFSPNGEFLRSWLSPGIRDIAVDRQGNVYVIDGGSGVGGRRDAGSVQVFSADGESLREWIFPHNSFGQYRDMGIAVHDDGNVYVANAGNQGVQVYSGTGQLLTAWITGTVRGPRRVALDTGGTVYVTDPPNSRAETARGADVKVFRVELPAP